MLVRTRSIAAAGLVLAALLLQPTVPPGAGPRKEGAVGSSSVPKLARTDRGVWDGTWLHVSRDFRMVVWMRTEKGRPQARLRYLGTKLPPEEFATDWSGQASYTSRKSTGTFSMDFTERDENLILGDWHWQVDFGNSSREEIGRFRLYRGGDGRIMTFAFNDYEQILRRPQRTDRIPFDNALVFRKVSKRLVEWDAIPI